MCSVGLIKVEGDSKYVNLPKILIVSYSCGSCGRVLRLVVAKLVPGHLESEYL